MKHLAFATGCLLAAMAGAATADTKPVLNVYTYDSFTSDWGPGPQIKKDFEATCGCEIRFTAAGDGAALLSRVRLEGARSKADVVLGLDTSLMAQAEATGLFAPAGVSAKYDLPIDWTDRTFVPFDWGYFAFVGNADGPKPHSFKELAESNARIVIEDPRSSTPGLGLLLWVKKAYGDKAPGIWKSLAHNIVTVTPGWSEAYGMFLDGEADLVLSYTTSPAYHAIAEDDDSKIALPFDEGQYMQVEVAAMTAHAPHRDLAKRFLQFLVSDQVQSILPTTNWMYPAVTPAGGLPPEFDQTIPADKALLMTPKEAEAARAPALEEWRTALAK